MDRIFSWIKMNKLEMWLIVFIGALSILLTFTLKDSLRKDAIINTSIDESNNKISFIQENLNNVILAKSFIVMDANSGKILLSKEPNLVLPMASLTKLMSTLVISERLPNYSLIPITKDAISCMGDNGLLLDEKWRLSDLIQFSLISSSNDGIKALATALDSFGAFNDDATTVSLMNMKATELGLNTMRFFNETGLDMNPTENGGYSSSEDLTRLMKYMLDNEKDLLEATSREDLEVTSESSIKHTVKNTNIIAEKIPSLIASKTGFTDYAGGNLIIAFNVGPDKRVIAVVLGSTLEGRFADMEQLVASTFKLFSTQKVDFNNI